MSSIRSYRGIKPQLGHAVYIDPQSCVIGDVRLSDDSSVWPMAVVRGDVNYITIGARSNVQDGSVLHVNRVTEKNPDGCPLIIGNDVTIGHKAVLHGCIIHDRVLVGMGAVILDGAIIEQEFFVQSSANYVLLKNEFLSELNN